MEFDYQGTWFLFNNTDIHSIEQDRYVLNQFPIVYIICDEDKSIAYVGETTNATIRMGAHLKHPDKSKLKKVYIISSEYFNKSAALDIESSLIQHMPSIGFKLLNGNGGLTDYNYYQKDHYQRLFENIWDNISFEKIQARSLLDIQNDDIFKYSPYKALTQDQYSSALEVLNTLSTEDSHSIFVDGSAGTGKTILAIYLMKLLSNFNRYDEDEIDYEDESLLITLKNLKDRYPDGLKIGLVVPMTSLRSTLKKVFSKIHGLSGRMILGPNDVTKEQYDLLIVDEAHRLARRKGITNYKSFDDTNKKLGLYNANNHGTQLDWVMRSSQHQVVFYDSEQSIRPADVRPKDFERYKIGNNTKCVQLVSQLRAKGGKDYIEFVDRLLRCNLTNDDKPFESSNYDLKLFDNMNDMIQALQYREEEVGLSRLMSGYSWKWESREDDSMPDAVIDGVELTWNRETSDWINSTTDVREMGCIHTVQGYDLNYGAVIFGDEVSYDEESNGIVIIEGNYYDKKGKVAISDEQELYNYIIKIYKTMLYRGIQGTYIYVCDAKLKSYISQFVTTYQS